MPSPGPVSSSSPALALRRALAAGEIAIELEPQEDRWGDAVAGEALARWPGSRLGPDVFVPVAEDSGLIHELGRQVLKQALTAEGAAVSVNVSPLQLVPGFVHVVDELLDACPSRPRLTLEVTEGRRMRAGGLRVLQRLHARGVRISLDDLGAGFATVEALEELPLDQAKLDRVLVGEHSSRLEELAWEAMRRGLELVVEGIETERERDRALLAGADLLQGRLVSRRHATESRAAGGRRAA